MNPMVNVSLEGKWYFTPENGARTEIQVPGGGWLKQGFDCEAGVYERYVDIPDTGVPQVVRLELGAVNHIAGYYIGKSEEDLKKIYEDVTAFTPQTVDLTDHVQAGMTYLLRIDVRAYRNGSALAPHWAPDWCESIARGIFREACLRVYPEIYIDDLFVRTYTETQTMEIDIRIVNTSASQRTIRLTGGISSCNGDDWLYPMIPDMEISLDGKQTKAVTLGPVDWQPGMESWWWPNIPYREGYRAKLHFLDLMLDENGCQIHKASMRFGFRQIRQAGPYYELNGIRVNFRGDNLQVANYDRIDNGGKGDAIDTLPGFLPPSEINPGWPKAVDNFQRLNFNVQREHMGPWTPYMIDICDEMGLMLIGESASRGGPDSENGRGRNEIKCLKDIVQRDKNHPCIIRWSVKNESFSKDPLYHLKLYEAVKSIDPTRPVSEDVAFADADWCELKTHEDVKKSFSLLLDKDDFSWMTHYLSRDKEGRIICHPVFSDIVVPMDDRPFGLGEANWSSSSTSAGITRFATTIALIRAENASDVRPYVFLSCCASTIPGVKTTDFINEERRHPVYGEDNLPNPWIHPGIQLLQKACSPLMAIDTEYWKINGRSNGWGAFPVVTPSVKAGSKVLREIAVFNDEFSGAELKLHWHLSEGSPNNRILQQGERKLHIKPGFHEKCKIELDIPPHNGFVYLVIRLEKEGVLKFEDDITCFEVVEGEEYFPSTYDGFKYLT